MQKETGTNEQTNTETPMTFFKGTETKYQLKTKRASVSKERKPI